jgi:predicted DNA-binding mobile mystery protein A
MAKKRLLTEQLGTRMKEMSLLQNIPVPGTGWIKSSRTAIGMSLVQLGNRLGITKQSVLEIENREQEGTLSLKTLREVAKAMDMKMVYGFVPTDGSLDALIERKATEAATKIVMRTSASMKLEGQENNEQRIQKAIAERADELKRELSKVLWD